MKTILPKYNMFDRIEAYVQITVNGFVYRAHISAIIVAIKTSGINSPTAIYMYNVVASLDRPTQMIKDLPEHKIVGLTDRHHFKLEGQ